MRQKSKLLPATWSMAPTTRGMQMSVVLFSNPVYECLKARVLTLAEAVELQQLLDKLEAEPQTYLSRRQLKLVERFNLFHRPVSPTVH